jgi:hypothetical protein
MDQRPNRGDGNRPVGQVFPAYFNGPDRSLSRSQEPATGPYPEQWIHTSPYQRLRLRFVYKM